MTRASRRPSLTLVVAIAVTAALGFDRPVTASWCGPTEPICSDFWVADAVFVGRVVHLGPDPWDRPVPPGTIRSLGSDDWRPAVIEVSEIFRGLDGVKPGGHVDVGLLMSMTGEPHVVFARREKGRLIVRGCWRTKPVSRAAEELAYARSLATSTATTARVFGKLEWEMQPRPKGTWPPPPPLPPATVIVRGQGIEERRLAVNQDGTFETRLPPGTYYAHAEVPATHTAEVRSSCIVISDARVCRRIGVAINWNGRVTGRVVGADGRPVAGLPVHYSSPAQGRPFWRTGWDRSGDDGTFAIDGLDVGEHQIQLGLELVQRAVADPSIPWPFERMLELTPAQHVDLGTVTLPAGTRYTTIRGRVLDAYGRPVKGAPVFLGEPGQESDLAPARTDGEGRYVFAAVPGRRYFVELLPMNEGDHDVFRSEPIEAGTTAGPPPIRLDFER